RRRRAADSRGVSRLHCLLRYLRRRAGRPERRAPRAGLPESSLGGRTAGAKTALRRRSPRAQRGCTQKRQHRHAHTDMGALLTGKGGWHLSGKGASHLRIAALLAVVAACSGLGAKVGGLDTNDQGRAPGAVAAGWGGGGGAAGRE